MAETDKYIMTVAEARQLARRIESLERNLGVGQSAQARQVQPEHYRYRHFEVQSVEDDYLVCRLYLPASDEVRPDDIAVAKPHELRRSAFEGKTITYENGAVLTYSYTSHRERTATNADDDTEAQVVVPDYYTGAVIIALAGNTGLTDSSDNPIIWTDMNNAARGWVESAGEDS